VSARAISGTRRAFKELVDGTLRVQIDVDPESRRDFLRLFPDIDMRVAIAPLRSDAKAQDEPKGGELARLAGILCSDEEFQLWIEEARELPARRQQNALIVRHLCGVTSRAWITTRRPRPSSTTASASRGTR
jgi:hypothetical protein